MELGATVCRAAAPGCDDCPLASGCAWRGKGDDPAQGSAGVSRAQSPFAGSERQARGRLLAAVVRGPVPVGSAPHLMGHRAAPRLIDALCAEGLVRRDGDWLCLP